MCLNVCTICFNDKDGLERTYNSILNQTVKPKKWIIIDGNSIDGSKFLLQKIREEYSDSLVIISEDDNGVYDAMNKGLFLADIDTHILFLNSGDFLKDNNCIESLLPILKANPFKVVYGHSEYLLYKSNKRLFRRANRPSYIRYSLPSIHQSIFYPTKLRESISYRPEYKISADYDFTLRASKIYNLFRVDKTISVFETGGPGLSSQRKFEIIFDVARSQREVLNMNYLLITLYAMIRFFKIYSMTIISYFTNKLYK